MPLPSGTRFRVTTRGGTKVRLAFKKGTNTVIEAKNLQSGATHTPKEFAADRRHGSGHGSNHRTSARSLSGKR